MILSEELIHTLKLLGAGIFVVAASMNPLMKAQ